MADVENNALRAHTVSDAENACGECPLVQDRRTFLTRASSAIAAALLVVAGTPERAAALITTVGRAGLPGAHRDERRYPIPDRDGATIDEANEVIIVRWQGTLHALALSCPHQNTAVRWREGDGQFQCPKHKSKYRPDGTFIEGRATRGMDRFAIRRDGDMLVVDLAQLHSQKDDAAGWARATIALAAK